MIIKETIERECCQPKDLKPYKGPRTDTIYFCQYCGSHYTEERVPDGAGSMENAVVHKDGRKKVS